MNIDNPCEPWDLRTLARLNGKNCRCEEAEKRPWPRQKSGGAPGTEFTRTRRYVYSMQAAPGAAPCLSLYHGA